MSAALDLFTGIFSGITLYADYYEIRLAYLFGIGCGVYLNIERPAYAFYLNAVFGDLLSPLRRTVEEPHFLP